MLFREAEKTDRGAEFAAAVRQIIEILRDYARVCGEPMWTFSNAKMEVRMIVERPVSVRYAVHQSAMEVVILDIDLMNPQ